ncbi:MAG: pyridoxamine 5'-phosphate oxidase family protein, partial [Pseudomonadota bacterium]
VKAEQTARGSRAMFAKRDAERRGFATRLTPQASAFIAQARSVFLATASAAGQPYTQHRGGPPGFIRVIDETTLAFVDFTGNRQYVTTGNLAENPRAFLFVMDYASQQRVKFWGRAKTVRGDDALITSLLPQGYDARAEQVILFEIAAWDANCPQHIPQLFHADDVARLIARHTAQVEALNAEIARAKEADRIIPAL